MRITEAASAANMQTQRMPALSGINLFEEYAFQVLAGWNHRLSLTIMNGIVKEFGVSALTFGSVTRFGSRLRGGVIWPCELRWKAAVLPAAPGDAVGIRQGCL